MMIAAKGVYIKSLQLICLRSSPKSWLQRPHEFPKVTIVATTWDPHNHPQSRLLQPHEIPKITIAATTRDLQNHNYRSNHIISIKILKTNFKKQLNNPLSWIHWDAQFLHPWSFTYKIHHMVYVWYTVIVKHRVTGELHVRWNSDRVFLFPKQRVWWKICSTNTRPMLVGCNQVLDKHWQIIDHFKFMVVTGLLPHWSIEHSLSHTVAKRLWSVLPILSIMQSFWPWILWLTVQSVLSSTREVAGGHTIHEHEDNDNYTSCIIMELLIMMWFSDQKWQKKVKRVVILCGKTKLACRFCMTWKKERSM